MEDGEIAGDDACRGYGENADNRGRGDTGPDDERILANSKGIHADAQENVYAEASNKNGMRKPAGTG